MLISKIGNLLVLMVLLVESENLIVDDKNLEEKAKVYGQKLVICFQENYLISRNLTFDIYNIFKLYIKI